MTLIHPRLLRILIFALILVVLTAMVSIQASVSPAAAQEPNGAEPIVTVMVIPEGDVGVASVETPPVFEVGDIFRVSIMALGVADPGIFGSQFEITYDTNHLTAVEGSLVPGSALEPVVLAVSNLDNAAGLVQYAAGRQGDVDNVTGNVVLANLAFEVLTPTEPQTTLIHLQNVKLGARGGVEIPISKLLDLEVVVLDHNTPSNGNIGAIVKVEGRTVDRQSGHTVLISNVPSSVTTEADGSFMFSTIEFGTFTIVADSPGFLAATCENVVHESDLTNLNEVVLLAGDINDDRIIDIIDAVAISTVFGSQNFGEPADMNADGGVDVLDLILLGANFGQTSAGSPWICQ